jgi:hypothetical protein
MKVAIDAGRLVLWAVALSSCSQIVDLEITQCTTNSDCADFGAGIVCDRNEGVCVAGAVDAAVSPASVRDGGLPMPDGADAAVLVPDGALPPDGGGTVVPERRCDRPSKPMVTIAGDITASDVLTCDNSYLLLGTVYVKPGVTLIIEKGTTVFGDGPSKGTLVVQPGARLLAIGTPDEPIVFTSALEPAKRAPGDWGGVILLGKAPVNLPTPSVEGITVGGEFGGTDENDSSGALSYVRIEYSGTRLGPNNEINGLTMGGVGRATMIDHVQVRLTADDCFEFFGGTVNAKYLICQYNGDDGFDWDNGYRGKLQFLVLQQDPRVVDETNGFEGDNDALGTSNVPRSEPTIYNATLCGKNADVEREQYGVLIRRASRAHIFNVVVSGFEAGLDLRDMVAPEVELSSSVFFGNLAANLAYAEDGSNTSTQKNDDGGLDEVAWLLAEPRRNSVQAPGIRDCFNVTDIMALAPAMPLTTNAALPPKDDFFDPKAGYVGAFRDAEDTWAKGKWVNWSDK